MGRGNRFPEYIADMRHEFVHIEIRLVDVIVHIIPGWFLFYQESDKRDDITHISHRLFILSFAYHKEFSSGNLFQ